MAAHAEPFLVGQALVVHGTVHVVSADGVTRVIVPNAPIFYDDRIETSGDGAVSIMLNDGDAIQLELGRMSTMTIDDDVMGGPLPDLGDVTVPAGLATDLLQGWEHFESLTVLDTVIPDVDPGSDGATAVHDDLPGLDNSPESVASIDVADDGFGSTDDDLDLSNLIPPPDDAS